MTNLLPYKCICAGGAIYQYASPLNQQNTNYFFKRLQGVARITPNWLSATKSTIFFSTACKDHTKLAFVQKIYNFFFNRLQGSHQIGFWPENLQFFFNRLQGSHEFDFRPENLQFFFQPVARITPNWLFVRKSTIFFSTGCKDHTKLQKNYNFLFNLLQAHHFLTKTLKLYVLTGCKGSITLKTKIQRVGCGRIIFFSS